MPRRPHTSKVVGTRQASAQVADDGGVTDVEALRRHLRAQEIGKLASLYVTTGSGLAVWRAYRAYRVAGLPVPDAIMQKFDAWALQLEDSEDVAAAIEMDGARSAKSLKDAVRRWEVASQVERLTRLWDAQSASPARKAEVFRVVARDHGLTDAAVKQIWRRWSEELAAVEAESMTGCDLQQAWGIAHATKVRKPAK